VSKVREVDGRIATYVVTYVDDVGPSGTLTLRRMYELVLELRTLKHEHGLLLHVTHVSGNRMIVQGTARWALSG
jgi:hypothetical protein